MILTNILLGLIAGLILYVIYEITHQGALTRGTICGSIDNHAVQNDIRTELIDIRNILHEGKAELHDVSYIMHDVTEKLNAIKQNTRP